MLTHTLTHTTISASGQARMYWTYDLRVSSKIAAKTAKSRCVATESWLRVAHNPEVVGSSPASATRRKALLFSDSKASFLCKKTDAFSG